jgi:hypothetical protein
LFTDRTYATIQLTGKFKDIFIAGRVSMAKKILIPDTELSVYPIALGTADT